MVAGLFAGNKPDACHAIAVRRVRDNGGALTVAYNIGDYVQSAGQGYKSLIASNQGNTPAGSPSAITARARP